MRKEEEIRQESEVEGNKPKEVVMVTGEKVVRTPVATRFKRWEEREQGKEKERDRRVKLKRTK